MFLTLFSAFLLLLTNLVLDGTMTTWLPIFILFFIFSGCFFCCCCCVVTLLRMVPKPQGQEVPLADAHAAATDRSAASTSSKGSAPSEEAPLLPAGSRYRTGGVSPPDTSG